MIRIRFRMRWKTPRLGGIMWACNDAFADFVNEDA